MIDVNNLSKFFVDKKLFENVNVRFLEGNIYGVIGANGAGKSTFLKILSREIEPSAGNIVVEKNRRISVLGQDHSIYNDEIATDVVIRGNDDLFRIQEEKNAIYENPNSTEKDYEKAADLEEKFGAMGGWNAENDAQILLSSLEIPQEKWYAKMSDLKANEKIKILLAKALFGNPDILIMDEPTNHLDLKSVKWLERFLQSYKNVCIVVSHDSDFLDEICTHIVDIDFGKAKMFSGNYSFWKESSELAAELTKRSNLKKEEKIAKLKEFIARFSSNLSKSSQATSRKKALEKIELEDIVPSNRKYPFIHWEIFRMQGKQILKVENLTYINKKGEVLFENVSFNLRAQEKMVILGNDDIAKTRLIQCIVGELEATSGTITWGQTIKYSYFPSDNSPYFKESEGEKSILNWLSQYPLVNTLAENKDNSDHRMRSFLGRMLFQGESVFKKVKVASGGEKARLMFSKMMLEEANFLILDQPLEHLDAESIFSVIEGLNSYRGGVIFTAYNRTLIRKVANVFLELKGSKATFLRADFDTFEGTLQD